MQKSKMQKSKKWALGLSVLMAAVLLIGGTFAWFTASDFVKNHLETAQIDDGSAIIEEIFTEPDEWMPGMEVTKRVSVANIGTGDILARVSFEEVLDKLAGSARGYTEAELGAMSPETKSALVPVYWGGAAYADWGDAAAAGITAVNGLPEGAVLKVKTDTDAANGRTSYGFVLYKALSGEDAGKFQKMTADFKVDGEALAITNVNEWYFPGRDITEAAWSVSNDQTGATPPATPAAGEIDRSALSEKILLAYSDDVTETIQPGKWWYNAADGFFYYIGKLAGGETSPEMLQSVSLAPDAGNDYSGMRYDLYVKLHAIQNTVDAIISTEGGGWGLPSGALLDALTEFCA